jgi:hypothetical protein
MVRRSAASLLSSNDRNRIQLEKKRHCLGVQSGGMSMLQGSHNAKTSVLRATRWFCCMLCGFMLLAPGFLYGGSDQKTSTYKVTKNVKSPAAELSSRNESLLALYSGR